MLSADLASRFKEVQDDKAMTLHDILEQMERSLLLFLAIFLMVNFLLKKTK